MHESRGILTDLGDIVIEFLSENGLELRGNSFFSRELGNIPSADRREWLEWHLCENTYFLLHGIIDQAYSLDSILARRNPGTLSVSGSVLLRTMLEYSYKLGFLITPDIAASERIKRAIEVGYADLREYESLPADLKGQPTEDRKHFLQDWYSEITGGSKLVQPIRVRGIFDSIGDPQVEQWPQDKGGNPKNPIYARGYQINSAVTHGNLWAIKHYGLTHLKRSNGSTATLPGLGPETIRLQQEIAARLLQLSFGLAVQFMQGVLPASTMNRLEKQMTPLLKELV